MDENRIIDRALSLRQMIKDERAGPVDRLELAVCYFHLKNYDKAIIELDQIRQKHSDFVDIARVDRLQVFCLIEKKQFADAVPLIKRRLSIDETDTMVLGMYAYLQEERGKPEEAIELHRRILSIDPEHRNSLNSLGYLLAMHGEVTELDEAYRCLVKVVEMKPEHPPYLDSLGVLLHRKGKKDHARKALLKALKHWPENSVIMEHLKDLLQLTEK